MRIFIAVLVLIFSLQSWTKADDIRDFQIEGMSIGDSFLDHFSEAKITSNKKNWFTNNKYTLVGSLKPGKIYDIVQLAFKTNDAKKNIAGIEAIIFYKDDIKGCLKQMDVIIKEIEKLFTNVKKRNKETYKHQYDKTGESTTTDVSFDFNTNDAISVACQDWSKKLEFSDQLRVQIRTKDYRIFLLSAYQ